MATRYNLVVARMIVAVGLLSMVAPGCASQVCEGDWEVTAVEHLAAVAGCQDITGNLLIRDLPGIYKIDELNGIRRVGGRLAIQQTNLSSIRAFDDLEVVGGPIDIYGNGSLSTIMFPALREAGGLSIEQNGVDRLEQFDRLTRVGPLNIRDNQRLEEITGFSLLRTVAGPMTVEQNPRLHTLRGFNGLSTTDGDVLLATREAASGTEFPTVDGFSLLRSLGDDLGSTLTIRAHTIRGFEGVRGRWPHGLSLTWSALDGFDRIETVAGDMLLHAKAGELEAFSSLTGVDGDLRIEGLGPQDLSVFDQVEHARDIVIDTPRLVELGAWSRLASARRVEVHVGPGTEDITGFNGIVHLERLDLVPPDGVAAVRLTRIDGFQSLTAIDAGLVLQDLPMLRDIDGFSSLESVGMMFADDELTGSLVLSGLPRLEQLGGLANIKTIGHGMVLFDIDAWTLPDWDELEVSRVSITHSGLLAVPSFSNQRWLDVLILENNTAMVDLGLVNLERVFDWLVIDNNPSLSCDTAQTFADRLTERAEHQAIYGNDMCGFR